MDLRKLLEFSAMKPKEPKQENLFDISWLKNQPGITVDGNEFYGELSVFNSLIIPLSKTLPVPVKITVSCKARRHEQKTGTNRVVAIGLASDQTDNDSVLDIYYQTDPNMLLISEKITGNKAYNAIRIGSSSSRYDSEVWHFSDFSVVAEEPVSVFDLSLFEGRSGITVAENELYGTAKSFEDNGTVNIGPFLIPFYEYFSCTMWSETESDGFIQICDAGTGSRKALAEMRYTSTEENPKEALFKLFCKRFDVDRLLFYYSRGADNIVHIKDPKLFFIYPTNYIDFDAVSRIPGFTVDGDSISFEVTEDFPNTINIPFKYPLLTEGDSAYVFLYALNDGAKTEGNQAFTISAVGMNDSTYGYMSIDDYLTTPNKISTNITISALAKWFKGLVIEKNNPTVGGKFTFSRMIVCKNINVS